MSNSAHTGLILVTGVDKPGVSESLFNTLAPFAVKVIDIEQVVIRDRLILTVLISIDPVHAKAIDADLQNLANEIDMDIAADFGQANPNVPTSKLLRLVLLSSDLKPSAIASVAKLISDKNGNIERINRVATTPILAIEFLISGIDNENIRVELTELASKIGVDLALVPIALIQPARKLVVLDIDSTLIEQEVIELIAAKANVAPQVKEITEAAMRGELDFKESLIKRVGLLAGLSDDVLDQVRLEISLTPGAKNLVDTLISQGHVVGVVSGGFTAVIEPLIKQLGIKHYLANTLEVLDGKLTGKVIGNIVDRAAKAQALKDFAASENIPLASTIAIGDGANDLDMITTAGFGIAFNAKPVVQMAADGAMNTPYLDSVLFLLGINNQK